VRVKHYEEDEKRFGGKRYKVKGDDDAAWFVYGWETEPDEDTEWSGCENRTGNVVAVMVGDDRKHSIDPDDLIEIGEDDYCHVCGALGCTHDGRERS
jgi:hypothetical protein